MIANHLEYKATQIISESVRNCWIKYENSNFGEVPRPIGGYQYLKWWTRHGKEFKGPLYSDVPDVNGEFQEVGVPFAKKGSRVAV